MTVLYGFKLDSRGKMMDRLFDLDKMPPDWYDSPDKVPGVKPAHVVEVLTDIIKAAVPADYDNPKYVFDGPSYPNVSKNRGGRPKGSKNKVRDV